MAANDEHDTSRHGAGDANTAFDVLARLVAWYVDVGVTDIVAEQPIVWRGRAEPPGAGFALPERARRSRPTEASSAARTAPASSGLAVEAPRPAPAAALPPTAAPGEAAQRSSTPARAPLRTFPAPARPRSSQGLETRDGSSSPRAIPKVDAQTLQDLATALAAFEGCGLKATAKNLVHYRGAERARVMIIGEAPGRDEDIAGKPFVGPAGQLLDRMLAAISLTEADVHITNTVYWRPPGNREPTAAEIAACAPFLDRQIALVAPDVLFVLGGIAVKSMLDTEEGITKVRGRWRTIDRGGRSLRTLPSFHPAYLLRSPAAKRKAWLDLLALRAELDGK